MKKSMPADQSREEKQASERDLRLDFFRGLALFSIFIDHVDWNSLVAQFTLQSLGFSDAAEVFIFISGYTAGMVYGRAIEQQGLLRAAMRIYHRVWQLYVAHVFLFMQFMATVAYLVDDLNNAIYAEEFRAADFLKEPGVAVIKALTLQFQPEFMDILPLYIVLLAVLPFVLVFSSGRRACWPPPSGSGARSNSTRVLRWQPIQDQIRCGSSTRLAGRPSSSGRVVRLAWDKGRDPLAHQPLAVLAGAGWRARRVPARCSWTLHRFYDPFPALFSRALWPLLSKTNLSLLLFANVLVLALLAARLISPQAKFLAGRVARPFVMCGRHSLHVFCLGILLATIGRLVINEFLGGTLLQCVVLAVGIAIMIGIAALMDWFNAEQSPSSPQVLRASATDGGV